ncbi:hypothetical protein CesoFtcFv8_022404 [Champsocephalus esox]|uniref:Helicase C-terminal domain-containing protein n=1 Tax=Champsocephalus esox TaxID=159716 RepID=A0AAN8BB45_9TELE|nr:hypothetical protein CesoFtcFv8_022404 [Champsocephalus esox]
MHPTAQIAVRASAPKPVLTVRPPTASCTTSIAAHPGPVPGSVLPQRVLLSPDMQARLPSGEVVSIAQLASLAGRPVSCQGSKPVTFQLQGNKLTLSGAQLHQVPAASPRSVQGNVMHLVTSGMQHHLISQTTQVTVQSAVSTSATAPASNRMPHNITAQVVPSLVSSPGVVKIVVRQTAGKDGGSVPTLAVAPSPRFGPLASLSPHPHATTTPVRIPAPLQIAQRTPGPATAHYTIAPPGNPSSTPNQLHPPRPILKVVHPPPPSTEQPAIPRRPPLSAREEWGRSGHSSALYAQWQNKSDFWFQSQAVREAIHSIDDRLELLNPIIDRFTFAIPPVEARPISMHCCHPPPSLSHKQAVFSTQLSAQVTPLARSLHRIQCYTRTQFPDLRLIQYDCGKLQTLHTLLRKLKTGSHRVLIFTQMTRMLDVLEQFLNYHGHIYLRLDGSTRVEMRQSLMERFNADRRIFCFILSTRSGGVGVNLTGADTVVFYDSDWNPTMDAQAQDRCHRIGQTRDVHIYRLISERTVEENILKKANQKRILGDMAIEGGNFTTAFFKEQTIRDLFDMNDGEKKEAAVELTVSQPEEEETVNKQSTTILEQALCRAEDEEDIVAASQAKAEQVAELAEFNENIPLDDAGEQEEVEELSKAEQEIAALVEQLTPIERYAMNFLEASLEDVCKEELKQAEEQVEAARKGLDQAKEEGLKLNASSDDDDDDNDSSLPASVEPTQPGRRGRKPKEASKNVSSTRTSGRLRGASPETEPEKSPTSPKEVPERLRCGLRRGAAKDSDIVSATPSHTDDNKTSSSTRLQDSSKSSKASSPARDQHSIKTRTLPNRSHPSPVPSPPTSSPPTRKPPSLGETDSKTSEDCREEKESESLPESSFPVDHEAKEYDTKDHSAMSPPSTSSRSPRKRQSADEEVLRGLVEDSPSAKVLRKLPGRLVTVVGEKEPRRRRRRRRGSFTGASSEEATAEENPSGSVEESNTKDNPSPSSDSKTKGAVAQFPQDQDSTPKPSVHHPPVRSYAPYSPAHLSPDMPVLRNLPVRRRLETESRMAAQLGEQLLSRGRANQSRKTETTPGKDTTSTESNVNSLVGNLKRKRGRPPKTPPRLPEAGNTVASSPQPTSQSEERNPPNSPKRKRGRPRKDSTTSPETISEEQNSKNESTENDASKEPTVLSLNVSETPIADVITTSQDSQSTKAEEMDTKTKEKAVAVTEKTEKVQVTTPLETASPSKEQTTAEKTVKIPSPVTTSTPAPLPTVTTTTSPPEKSMTVSTTNIKTTRVSSTIVAPVTRSTVEVNPTNTVPVSTTQTTADVPLQVQCSASSEVPTPAPSSVTSEKQSLKHKAPASKSDPDGLEEVGKTEAEAKASKEEDQDEETDIRKSQRKRRKVESSSGAKDFESSRKGTLRGSAAPKEEPKQKGSEQTPIQKRPLSRQSSQDSARSSSSSSGCSTLTRQAHHKRTYENRLPTKKRRLGDEENNKEDKKHTSRGRRSRSSSSSDSDTSEHREEHRLTRSAKHRLQHQEREKGNSRQGKTPDRSASNNTNASTGGESGSDTSSVRTTRKSAGSKPSQESKAQTNSAPLIPPEPEVLGKRCSALNAAAKLLAMKGRVDTPGHTTRKDSSAKAAGTSPASSDKNQKPKSKSVPASPQSNSLNLSNNKSSSSKTLTPNQTSHSASRSTRQRPGSLVPPLEVEYKRSKADEKDRGARRSSRIKEGEAEALSSSRGHSACSSVSSDGEGDAGGRSSRSRSSSSSSNSSQRTRSISSQNTERRESRATSSGSERERDRSSESRDKRDRHRRESLRSHKLTQEVTSSSGAEGTPDRVLRSVAALAAVQARSPAASTRSSFGHHRHNKT